MNDKLYKCPECNVSNTGDEWNKKTMEFCGTDDIHPIEKEEFGNFFYCPSCEKEIDGMSIQTEDTPKDKCEYCEVDVNDRKALMDASGYSKIYIGKDNYMESDYTFGVKFKLCPMCGREL